MHIGDVLLFEACGSVILLGAFDENGDVLALNDAARPFFTAGREDACPTAAAASAAVTITGGGGGGDGHHSADELSCPGVVPSSMPGGALASFFRLEPHLLEDLQEAIASGEDCFSAVLPVPLPPPPPPAAAAAAAAPFVAGTAASELHCNTTSLFGAAPPSSSTVPQPRPPSPPPPPPPPGDNDIGNDNDERGEGEGAVGAWLHSVEDRPPGVGSSHVIGGHVGSGHVGSGVLSDGDNAVGSDPVSGSGSGAGSGCGCGDASAAGAPGDTVKGHRDDDPSGNGCGSGAHKPSFARALPQWLDFDCGPATCAPNGGGGGGGWDGAGQQHPQDLQDPQNPMDPLNPLASLDPLLRTVMGPPQGRAPSAQSYREPSRPVFVPSVVPRLEFPLDAPSLVTHGSVISLSSSSSLSASTSASSASSPGNPGGSVPSAVSSAGGWRMLTPTLSRTQPVAAAAPPLGGDGEDLAQLTQVVAAGVTDLYTAPGQEAEAGAEAVVQVLPGSAVVQDVETTGEISRMVGGGGVDGGSGALWAPAIMAAGVAEAAKEVNSLDAGAAAHDAGAATPACFAAGPWASGPPSGGPVSEQLSFCSAVGQLQPGNWPGERRTAGEPAPLTLGMSGGQESMEGAGVGAFCSAGDLIVCGGRGDDSGLPGATCRPTLQRRLSDVNASRQQNPPPTCGAISVRVAALGPHHFAHQHHHHHQHHNNLNHHHHHLLPHHGHHHHHHHNHHHHHHHDHNNRSHPWPATSSPVSPQAPGAPGRPQPQAAAGAPSNSPPGTALHGRMSRGPRRCTTRDRVINLLASLETDEGGGCSCGGPSDGVSRSGSYSNASSPQSGALAAAAAAEGCVGAALGGYCNAGIGHGAGGASGWIHDRRRSSGHNSSIMDSQYVSSCSSPWCCTDGGRAHPASGCRRHGGGACTAAAPVSRLAVAGSGYGFGATARMSHGSDTARSQRSSPYGGSDVDLLAALGSPQEPPLMLTAAAAATVYGIGNDVDNGGVLPVARCASAPPVAAPPPLARDVFTWFQVRITIKRRPANAAASQPDGVSGRGDGCFSEGARGTAWLAAAAATDVAAAASAPGDATATATAASGGSVVLLLNATDVSEWVESQERLEGLLRQEHKVLEAIFPRHVIEHVARRAHSRPSNGPNMRVAGVETHGSSSCGSAASGWARPAKAQGNSLSQLSGGSRAIHTCKEPSEALYGTSGGASLAAAAAAAVACNGPVPLSRSDGGAADCGSRGGAAVGAALGPSGASVWPPGASGGLPDSGVPLATAHRCVTVLFADIVGFTSMCNCLEPLAVMTFLNGLYTRFDQLCDIYGVYKVETIGDCFMAVGGLITVDGEGFKAVRSDGSEDPLHAVKVMSFAKAMLREVADMRMPHNGTPLRLRVGLHSGAVTAGIVGSKMPRFCLFGDTVNTASRMESTCEPGAIHVSAATQELLPEETWVATGGVQVKGKGEMQTYLWRPSPPPFGDCLGALLPSRTTITPGGAMAPNLHLTASVPSPPSSRGSAGRPPHDPERGVLEALVEVASAPLPGTARPPSRPIPSWHSPGPSQLLQPSRP